MPTFIGQYTKATQLLCLSMPDSVVSVVIVIIALTV